MTLTDTIKQSLEKRDLTENTIKRYINDTARIYNDIHGIQIPRKTRLVTPEEFSERVYAPLNKEKNFKWIRDIDKIEKYFDEKDRATSTRNTIYNSIIEVLKAIDHPDKEGLEDLIQQRQKYGDEYNSIEDGLKSKKQEDSFIDAKFIDDKIDTYEKKIEGGDHDPDLLQIWMILKLLNSNSIENIM